MINVVAYDTKLKEYLLNYMSIKGQCGNFNSAINSLKWFGWSKYIDISKLLKTDNEFQNQFILDYFDIKKKYRLNHQLLTAAFLHFPDDCELEEIAGKSFYRESGEKVIDFWKGEGLWQPGNQEALEALALKRP